MVRVPVIPAAKSMVQRRSASRHFDVFLAHNSQDKIHVRVLAAELRARDVNPWLDEEQIAPGRWFQDVIQNAIRSVKCAAICVGPNGLGKWEALELRAFVRQCVEANLHVIPVLLPGLEDFPMELVFLRELKCVRFTSSLQEQEALDDLEWGITGNHPKVATGTCRGGC